MSRLRDILQAKGLDNFDDERRDGGLGGLGVGWEVEVVEGSGGDGADGDAWDLLWKT